MNPNTLKAIIRSLMPFVYSGVAAIIAHFGYHVSNSTVIQIVAAGFAAATVILHSLEVKFPWVGVFLGWIGAPAYAPSTKVTLVQQLAAQQLEIDGLRKAAGLPPA